jgi:transposase InsO family protein
VRSRPRSQREIRHAWLTDLIREVNLTSRGVYGSRRVHAKRVLGRQVAVGHGAVELLMRRAGIVGIGGIGGIGGRASWKYTKLDMIGSDLARREFARQRPNKLWVTDTTRRHPRMRGSTTPARARSSALPSSTPIRAGSWVGRSTPRRQSRLVTNALGMAIDSRAGPGAEAGTIVYSDHGMQFASWAFTKRVEDSGLLPLWSNRCISKA